ncbi:MAG: signal peptidase II [Oscillospiraceae bacterium]|jgi:signal peptidase II|nr:signal peptidase II [Oscillospiraceae bacterium]
MQKRKKLILRLKFCLRLAAIAMAAGLVVLDQYIKAVAVRMLKPQGAMQLVRGVLGLQYTENTGISFSLFEDSMVMMWVVTIVTSAVMLAGVLLILSGRLRQASPLCAAALIIAGGTGNLLDRLLRGFVVDYLEFLFVRFAVFNFADICIAGGVAWLTIWMIWEEAQHRKAGKKSEK